MKKELISKKHEFAASTTSNYAGEAAAGYISAALLSGETLAKQNITILNNVKYKGVKLFNGKKMLMFQTKANRQLTINPSFHTFTLEKTDKE